MVGTVCWHLMDYCAENRMGKKSDLRKCSLRQAPRSSRQVFSILHPHPFQFFYVQSHSHIKKERDVQHSLSLLCPCWKIHTCFPNLMKSEEFLDLLGRGSSSGETGKDKWRLLSALCFPTCDMITHGSCSRESHTLTHV